MAILYPSFEIIKELKPPPTEGEFHLLKYLAEHFNDEVEIYFQPFLNGDQPDIIMMQKDVGVTIIEVKDWNLSSYKLNENNGWSLRKNNANLRSPFQQVFQYKENMFNLHINGLLQESIKNKQFYGRIQPYVYFHKASKKDIDDFYGSQLNPYKEQINRTHSSYKEEKISYEAYEKQLKYLNDKKLKIERDLNYHSIGNDSLQKIRLPKQDRFCLFTEPIYKEFHRFLQPPFHTIEQGMNINYTPKQIELSFSKAEQKKIKGVAGSGKTLILAKRAVNAYKRHQKRVLVLSFNITLTRYIHDKISAVREEFPWDAFYITNYHQFINQTLNNMGIKIEIDEEDETDTTTNKSSDFSEKIDREYYSNINLFENKQDEIHKYESIFIDEIQDYKVEWIRLIKKYFLCEDGEFVVFGDEKQNIYDRVLDGDKKPNTTILGRWNILNESFRFSESIAKLSVKFQQTFFADKYDIDNIEVSNSLLSKKNDDIQFTDSGNTSTVTQRILDFDNSVVIYEKCSGSNSAYMAEKLFEFLRLHSIHPNDVSIISDDIKLLQEIDYLIRKQFNEKTLTTFETKEILEKIQQDNSNPNISTKIVDNVRKKKKYSFNLNNGTVKLSTIHSFKGCEAPTLCLVIDKKNDELTYTAMTRSRENLIIFDIGGIYSDFFDRNI
jgi:hypothetical protein